MTTDEDPYLGCFHLFIARAL